jgi:hypothetical protein
MPTRVALKAGVANRDSVLGRLRELAVARSLYSRVTYFDTDDSRLLANG